MIDSFTSAFWSAVAATFAALSSLLLMLIHRRNLIESIRPELVLTGWTRSERGERDKNREAIRIATIKNVGRGAALEIRMNVIGIDKNENFLTIQHSFQQQHCHSYQ